MKSKKQILKAKTSLSDLLNPFFLMLNERNISYGVCGNYEHLPEYTTHDVDIWVENVEKAKELLFKIARDKKFILFLNNTTSNGSNNVFYKELQTGMKELQTGMIEFIKIDLLHECAWKSLFPIVKTEIIKNHLSPFKNFYVVNKILETVMHLLFPLVSLGKIKDKYKEKIYELSSDESFKRLLCQSIGKYFAEDLIRLIQEKKWKEIERNRIRCRINLMLRTIFSFDMKRIICFAHFLILSIKRIISPVGLFIVFLGPDGCGKTTALDQLAIFHEEAFLSGKNKNYYWRPYLFPPLQTFNPFRTNKIKEETAFTSNRNVKVNETLIMRMYYVFKFLYYAFDYIFGKLKYQLTWSFGGLVCFDRYYHDMIVYSERFAFKVPHWMMKVMEHLIPKPDLIFVLSSPAKILYKRKAEFPLDEIRRQIDVYDNLAKSMKNIHIIDTNESVEKTQASIINICLEYMAKRYR